jgi:adenosyl cobinamide kinase/adenosyl cobinamide phosphate guanylyltransferase
MNLIIGGAYQGKLDYAKTAYAVSAEEVSDCSAGPLDFSKRCIYHLEAFVLDCVREGRDAIEIFEAHGEQWRESVIICNDISAGVVPMDAELRAWREATGRLLNHLSPRAEQVTRIFCGLPQRLKG